MTLKKIWWYISRIGALILVIAGLIFTVWSIKSRSDRKKEIDNKLRDVQAIENKTAEDLQEIERLKKEKENIENEILDITKKYKEKVDNLKKKPDESTPGDAGRSSDDLNKVW
jgi:septal ring factor EnvC (AmiA/AmiB activator)